mmetsp:Transcript_17215/g.28870  ORF Transcript_17215/g.28870 Transcript_17215/m.28870 type:complete len:338 (+) Transcript_17215:49-1062(+)
MSSPYVIKNDLVNKAGSNPSMWLLKGDNGIDTFRESGNINDVRMSCDCQCPDCKALYNAYLEEKALAKFLQQRVDEDKEDSAEMISQVKQMEEDHRHKIKAMKREAEALQGQVDAIQQQLDYERKVRMEDVYKLEFSKEENIVINSDVKDLQSQLSVAIQKLPLLQRENEILKGSVAAHTDTITKLCKQLKNCESELSRVDEINTSLRLRLNESDAQVEKYRLKNNSRVDTTGGARSIPIGTGMSFMSSDTYSLPSTSPTRTTGTGSIGTQQRRSIRNAGRSTLQSSSLSSQNPGRSSIYASNSIRRFTPHEPSLLETYCKKHSINMPRMDLSVSKR